MIASQQRIADTFCRARACCRSRSSVSDVCSESRDPDHDRPAPAQANILWFLPTHGDGRYLGTTDRRAATVNFDYLRQIAQAADQLGYFGVLLPTGRSCEDSWVVASAVAPWTERLRFLVAVRPGLQSPSVAARMTATLDRLSNGRLLINVVTGGDPVENKGDGIFLDHDERYAVTREFLDVYSDLLAGKTVNFEGKHIRIEDGRLLFPPVQIAASAAVFRRLVGGRHRCRRRYRRQISDLGRAAGAGRREGRRGRARRRASAAASCRFGIRLHVIVRETKREAWEAADELIEHVTDETIAAAQKIFARMDSVGQQRMAAAAWRAPRQARGQPEPVGRRRPGARRRRHGAGRRSRRRWRRGSRNIRTSASIPSSCRAIRIWRKPIASPNWCSRCCRWRSRSNVTPLRVNTGPFGETIANEHRPLVKASQS